jgi:two-component system response regulator HydG
MEGWSLPAALQVLVVDQDERHAALVEQVLSPIEPGIRVRTVTRLRAAVDALARLPIACVVTELRLGDAEGVRIVRDLRATRRGVPVVVATDAGSEDIAVAVLKLGAADYVRKGEAHAERLATVLRDVLGRSVLAGLDDEAPPPHVASPADADDAPLIATTAPMHRVLALVDRASGSAVPVLLEGETGTGKELLALAIHRRGPRRAQPFLAQNCAALSDTLLESELFGHVRGAFTGADRERRGLLAEAGGGTVFLDEIAEASPSVQAKLLRVLQHGEAKALGADRVHPVRARFVAAGNRPLADEVRAGRFRADLYYRLAVLPITVPPLRHRAADVPHLLTHFLRRFEQEEDHPTGGFAADALHALETYAWPGNVRELEHEVHRLVLTIAAGERIGRRHLTRAIRESSVVTPVEPLGRILRRVELALVRQRIAEQPTKAAAARSLGITREALYAKLRRLGLAVARDEGE